MRFARLAALIPLTLPIIPASVRIAPGVILVAGKQLDDPNFEKTVVVIAEANDQGVLGLVLNRRSELPLNEVLEKWKEASRVKDPIFLGGPVGREGMFALIRVKATPEGAKRVTGDIHLVTDREGLAPHLSEGPARVRVYAGYTGWAPDQLESEIAEGGWHVLPANPRLVFDDDPDTLWLRLSRNIEMQVARNYRTNLYPTPWTVIRCFGSPCSSFARMPAM
jgi:putative transcriptional regulator